MKSDPKNYIIVSILVIMSMYFIFKSKYAQCPKQNKIIEYRYVPRTFKEEQKDPVSLTDLYRAMFMEKSIKG